MHYQNQQFISLDNPFLYSVKSNEQNYLDHPFSPLPRDPTPLASPSPLSLSHVLAAPLPLSRRHRQSRQPLPSRRHHRRSLPLRRRHRRSLTSVRL